VRAQVPGREPVVRFGCSTRPKVTSEQLPPLWATSSFALYFPPGKRIDFDPGPVNPGERHWGFCDGPVFSIGRLSGKSCIILAGSMTVMM
jgi:hypothetical protein